MFHLQSVRAAVLLQFISGVAPADCLVDVVRAPQLSRLVPLVGVLVPAGCEGVAHVQGGGRAEGGVAHHWRDVDGLVDLRRLAWRYSHTERLRVVVTEVVADHHTLLAGDDLAVAVEVVLLPALLVQGGHLPVHLHLCLVGEREVIEVEAGGQLLLYLVSEAGGVVLVAGSVFICPQSRLAEIISKWITLVLCKFNSKVASSHHPALLGACHLVHDVEDGSYQERDDGQEDPDDEAGVGGAVARLRSLRLDWVVEDSARLLGDRHRAGHLLRHTPG